MPTDAPTPAAAPTGATAPARPSSFKSHVASVGETPAPTEVTAATGAPAANDNAVSPRPQRTMQPRRQPQPVTQAEPPPEVPEMDAGALEGEAVEGEDGAFDDEPFDLAEAEIHGIKAIDLFKAISEGKLPRELYDKLTGEWEIGGAARELGLHEVPNAIMRQSDYSRGMAEVKRMKAEADQQRGEAISYLQRQKQQQEEWKRDPAAFRRDLRRMGLGQTFVDAARAFAQQMTRIDSLHPDARQYAAELMLREEAQEDHAWQQEQRQQQTQREDAQRARRQREDQYRAQLGELVPQAYAKHGLKDGRLTSDVFQKTLMALWDTSKPITPELIDEVARSTKEELEDIAIRFAGQQQAANTNGAQAVQQAMQPTTASRQQQGAQPLSPRRVAPAAGSPQAKPTSMRPRDFAKWMKQKGYSK